MKSLIVEIIGWLSTVSFLISILVPNRKHLHYMGVFSSITTGFYAYHYGATAIWVKWVLAFFFHSWMILKLSKSSLLKIPEELPYSHLYP